MDASTVENRVDPIPYEVLVEVFYSNMNPISYPILLPMPDQTSIQRSRPIKLMGIEDVTGSLVSIPILWPNDACSSMESGISGPIAGNIRKLELDPSKYGISALKMSGLGNESNILLTDHKICTVFSGDRINPANCLLTPKVLCFDGRLVWCMGKSKSIWVYNYRQRKFLTKLNLAMIIGDADKLIEDPIEHLVKMQRMRSRKDVIISLWRLPNMYNSNLVFSRYRKKKMIKTFDLNKVIGKRKGKATLYDMMLIHNEKTIILVGTSIMFPANQAALIFTCSIDGQCKLMDCKELFFSNNARKRVLDQIKQVGNSQEIFLALNSFNGWIFKVSAGGMMQHLGELIFSKEEHMASQYTEILPTGPTSADLLRCSKSGFIYLIKIRVN